MDFDTMCAVFSEEIGREVKFISPNLLSFSLQKRKKGVPSPFIIVMIMLHYLPRFQAAHERSNWAEKLLGRRLNTFREFVKQKEKN